MKAKDIQKWGSGVSRASQQPPPPTSIIWYKTTSKEEEKEKLCHLTCPALAPTPGL